MQISKLTRDLLKYLPVLAVLVVTAIGLVIGKDLYPISIDSQTKTPTELPTEPSNTQLLPIPGVGNPCFYTNIYTSLPPKCRTFDGEFIPLPGTSNVLVIPEVK
jgi:hypothetical protein